jgi:hypothetical protein
LSLSSDILVSKLAFKCNLYRYNTAEKLHPHRGGGGGGGEEEEGGEPSQPAQRKMNGLRSLHVHGAADAMVSRARVEALMNAFHDPELFAHAGGHGIPTGADFRTRLKEFILAE